MGMASGGSMGSPRFSGTVHQSVRQQHQVTPAPEFCFLWIEHWSMCMSKAEWSGWAQAVGAVVGIGVALAFPIILAKRARRKERQGHLETIAADVLMAERQARVYLQANIMAPAYRLPLLGLRSALPALLADGTLHGSDGAVLSQFYIDATSFNYCLDVAQGHRSRGRSPAPEHGRARTKARHLVGGTRNSRYDAAVPVLRKHLPPDALERLQIPTATEEGGDDQDTDPSGQQGG